MDRWLRWHLRQQRIEGNDAAIKTDPGDRGLRKANDALKRQLDRWKLPKGWKSWEELGEYVKLQSKG
jgi:hypothetical protein